MAPEDAPATKRDIRELDERMLERMREMKTELLAGVDERLTGMDERLQERMRDMQTELLKAFLPYQEQTRLRDAALEARQAALEGRFHTVEGRLVEIEKRLFLNPPAA
jgi:pyrimidine operon attenuation protein/uracil phosphoribosyltransferase